MWNESKAVCEITISVTICDWPTVKVTHTSVVNHSKKLLFKLQGKIKVQECPNLKGSTLKPCTSEAFAEEVPKFCVEHN